MKDEEPPLDIPPLTPSEREAADLEIDRAIERERERRYGPSEKDMVLPCALCAEEAARERILLETKENANLYLASIALSLFVGFLVFRAWPPLLLLHVGVGAHLVLYDAKRGDGLGRLFFSFPALYIVTWLATRLLQWPLELPIRLFLKFHSPPPSGGE